MNKSILSPRLRVNKTTPLVLTANWQDVVFDGTSPYNVNTFGNDSEGRKMVTYTSNPNKFMFYELYDQNYQVNFFAKTTATIVSTGVMMQYRLVIPNGISQGNDMYFPFPDGDGFADLAFVSVKLGAVNHIATPIPMYLNSTIKANGVRMQVRLSDSLVGIGSITLNNAILLIQQ